MIIINIKMQALKGQKEDGDAILCTSHPHMLICIFTEHIYLYSLISDQTGS